MIARQITRRRLLRTAFWSTLAGGAAGTALSACRYAYPDAAVRAALVTVPAADVPAPGADPLYVRREGFFVVNLHPGQGIAGGSEERLEGHRHRAPGGVLAVGDRCTRWHRPPIRVGWVAQMPDYWPESDGAFRCPCCGSTYTRAGLGIFGPAPWPLDALGVRVLPDGSIVVHTKQIRRGGPDNPERVVPLVEPRTERASSLGNA